MEVLLTFLLVVCCGVCRVKAKADADSVLFYVDSHRQQILKIPASGGDAKPLNISKAHVQLPRALAYDQVHNCLYWADGRNHAIFRYFLGSHLLERMDIQEYQSAGIAVDEVNNLLYTTNFSPQLIMKVDFDNKTSGTVISENVTYPFDIAVDSHNGWLYWSDQSGRIEKARTDGRDHQTLVITGIVRVYGVALDHHNSRLYFCGSKVVQSIGVDGKGRKTHFRDESYEFSAIALDDQYFYLRTSQTSWKGIWRLAINSVNATGQQLQHLTNTSSASGGIVLVESSVHHKATDTDVITGTAAHIDVSDVTGVTDVNYVDDVTDVTDVSDVADVSDVTEQSIKVTHNVWKVHDSTTPSSNSPEIYQYVSLAAVPIALILTIAFTAFFCYHSGKYTRFSKSGTGSQQDDEALYEEIDELQMSGTPGAQSNSGVTSVADSTGRQSNLYSYATFDSIPVAPSESGVTPVAGLTGRQSNLYSYASVDSTPVAPSESGVTPVAGLTGRQSNLDSYAISGSTSPECQAQTESSVSQASGCQPSGQCITPKESRDDDVSYYNASAIPETNRPSTSEAHGDDGSKRLESDYLAPVSSLPSDYMEMKLQED